MTLEEAIARLVKQAVHEALDERDGNALPELYTLKQVEERYHGAVTAKQLGNWCRSGVLPYVRFSEGGAYYLKPEGLRTAIERCTHNPPTERPRIPRKATTT